MTELSKRIYTSFALIIIFTLSIFNNFILALILMSCFYIIFFEFFNLLKKIFSNNKNIKIYFSLFSNFIVEYLFDYIYLEFIK